MNKENKAKLLIVSWPVLPAKGGSVFVVENLIQHLDKDDAVVFGELAVSGSKVARKPGTPEVHYFRSGISFFGRGARYFSWLRWFLFPILVRRICKLIESEKCSHVLGIYPDELYCLAACRAAEKMNVPFSTYFHNTYLDNTAVDLRRASRIQPELFSKSQTVFVMSEGMEKFFKEKYQLPHIVPLVHTFESYPESNETATPDLRNKEKMREIS